MSPKQTHRGGLIVNGLTILFALAIPTVSAFAAHVFVFPQSEINPLPPPEGMPLPLAFLSSQSEGTQGGSGIAGKDGQSAVLSSIELADASSEADIPSDYPYDQVSDLDEVEDDAQDADQSLLGPADMTESRDQDKLNQSEVPLVDDLRDPSEQEVTEEFEDDDDSRDEDDRDPEYDDDPDPVSTPKPPSLPECTNHDPSSYHGLINRQGTCHYDHTHNQNPADGDALFGPLPLADTISYPWQTSHHGVPENLAKHEGYKWDVEIKDQCLPTPDIGYPDCVMGWRIEHHTVGGALGALTRFHSYWAEVLVCDQTLTNCGIIRTGGHSDFGILEVPYKNSRVPLPNDAPELDGQSLHSPPYRGHRRPDQCYPHAAECLFVWNSSDRYGYGRFVTFDFRVHDDFGGVDPSDPSEENFICPDFQCKFNHSEFWVYNVLAVVPASLDTDGDGFVTFTGFVDPRGNIDPSCTQAGPNCAPLIIENAPVGRFGYQLRGGPPVGRQEGEIEEFDLSPPGEWWIEYPN